MSSRNNTFIVKINNLSDIAKRSIDWSSGERHFYSSIAYRRAAEDFLRDSGIPFSHTIINNNFKSYESMQGYEISVKYLETFKIMDIGYFVIVGGTESA